jgi:ribonuclease HI
MSSRSCSGSHEFLTLFAGKHRKALSSEEATRPEHPMNKQFFIFTDGSAIGNPGPAGWAAIVLHGTRRQEIDGMRFLVFRWRRYGWRNSRGFDLQHQELWCELLLLSADRTIRWRWVKGHSGHPIQSRADAIAYQAARAAAAQERIAA